MLTPLTQLALDAGPLIALMYSKDTQHSECKLGFEQIGQNNVRLLTPIPIVFEVYKWLLYTTNPTTAQTALNVMVETLHLIALSQQDFLEIYTLIANLPNWRGSLEDATVFWVAQRYKCPVWTLNYRDFSIFPSLEFWNPDIS